MTRQMQQTTRSSNARQTIVSADGATFSSGVMYVNGNAQVPVESQQWESSNGVTIYTTVKWQDPATGDCRVSCNCPGWTNQKKNQSRRCKHSDDMTGVKPCNAKKATYVSITTVRAAEEAIPQLDGRSLRGLMLD